MQLSSALPTHPTHLQNSYNIYIGPGAGSTDQSEATHEYQTVAELQLSTTDLSDEPAKADTDDNIYTTITTEPEVTPDSAQ